MRLRTLPPRLATHRPANAPRQVASTEQQGLGWSWQKLRLQILKRDCGLCQPCARAGRITPGNEVDHIIPRFEGGGDEESNLQTICPACHEPKSAAEGRRKMGIE